MKKEQHKTNSSYPRRDARIEQFTVLPNAGRQIEAKWITS
jgi:hypothetical protein